MPRVPARQVAFFVTSCCVRNAAKDLDVPQIPYRAVEVNPLTKKELKWSAHRKVPVAMLDEEVLLDSSVIVSRLAAEAEAAKAQRAQPPTKGGWLGRKAAPASAPQPSAASLGEPQRTPQQT